MNDNIISLKKREKFNPVLITGTLSKSLTSVPLFSPLEENVAFPITFNYTKDIYSYLRQQNLSEFLGIEEKYFNCIFHKDSDHRASIYQKDDGNWVYKCFYDNCPFKIGDINKVTECLTKLNRPDTLRYLMSLFNIVLEKTDEQKRQEEIIESNIDMLMDSDDLRKNYPALYGRIKSAIPHLLILHEYAKRNLTLEDAIKDKYVTFTAPMREVAMQLIEQGQTGRLETVSKRTNVLAFLGMILKLSDSEFNSEELKKIREFSKNNGYSQYLNLYGLPSYDYETLTHAENKSIEFKESGMTVGNFTSAMLNEYTTKEEVREVWPRYTEFEKIDYLVVVGEEIEQEILSIIGNKGYCLYSDILKNKMYKRFLYRKFGRECLNEKIIEKAMKTIVPKISASYGYVAIRVNNELKEKLDLTMKGYPKIIIQKDLK